MALPAGCCALTVLIGMVGGSAFASEAPSGLPTDDADRGMIYSGLALGEDGLCAGLYQVKGVSPAMCTHGPDPAPPGLSVKRSVQPIAAAPTAASASANALAVCEGDGTSGRRVEVLYVHGSTSGFAGDTRKTDSNRSNFGPEYARADSGCWSAGVAAHELGHTLGAVNNNSPNTSGHAHCTDEWDVMCYRDAPEVVLQTRCADRAHDQRLDCNHDDYYHTNPAAGSYLATNFNVADNLFLIKGTGSGPAPEQNRAPAATPSASFTSPWESVAALNDGAEPTQSNDVVNPRWGTWPNTGEQWALLTWPSAQTLSSAEVYFFDDNGGVRLPSSWRLQSWNGSAYVDVAGASGYPTALNQYNRVTFGSVSTTRLRVLLQSGAGSVGLLEVKAYST